MAMSRVIVYDVVVDEETLDQVAPSGVVRGRPVAPLVYDPIAQVGLGHYDFNQQAM